MEVALKEAWSCMASTCSLLMPAMQRILGSDSPGPEANPV